MTKAKLVTSETVRLSLEQLIERTASRSVEAADSSNFYIRTYPLQLAEFAKLRERRAWVIDDVLMRFCSVYGWMPRGIQQWNVDAVSQLATLLNEDEPDCEELVEAASRCINSSIVGASKFLHFFDPYCFPILDSVVGSLWWKKNVPKTVSHYFAYRTGVITVSDHAAQAAQAWAKHWMGYNVTSVRAIEALAFYTQRESTR